MANEDDWEDGDDNSQTPEQPNGAPKGLRAHAKKLDDENKQLKAKLDELEDAARKERVGKVLTTKGFDPKVADIIPKEVASDESALDKWLTEREGMFAKVQKESDQTVEQGFGDEILDEDSEGYMRVSRVASSALPATKETDLRSAIANAKTKEEMAAILKKQGNTFVS